MPTTPSGPAPAQPRPPLPSRVVLITGASSGIGHATAARLVQAGWPVYASARDPKPLDALRDLGCHTLSLDVTDPSSIRTAVARIEGAHGAIGVLINNAGYSQSGALESLPPELLRRQLETNVIGPIVLAQRVLPAMRAQGWGKIVNVSSMGGHIVLPGGGASHASEHALEAASDALRFEVARFGIDVILVQPGLVRSGFARAVAAALPPTARDPDSALDPDSAASVYASFNRAVEQLTQVAYPSGPGARLTGPPEAVARVIQRAIEARHPKTRYKVGPAAQLVMALHRWLPDRAWDRLMTTQYPQPGP